MTLVDPLLKHLGKMGFIQIVSKTRELKGFTISTDPFSKILQSNDVALCGCSHLVKIKTVMSVTRSILFFFYPPRLCMCLKQRERKADWH